MGRVQIWGERRRGSYGVYYSKSQHVCVYLSLFVYSQCRLDYVIYPHNDTLCVLAHCAVFDNAPTIIVNMSCCSQRRKFVINT